MIDSQSRIIERLQAPDINDSARTLVIEVMEFYKGHISKLQSMIVDKQRQIEDLLAIESATSIRAAELAIENERLKSEEANAAGRISRDLKLREEEIKHALSSFKSDVENLEFDKRVLEQSLANLRSKSEIVEKQNLLLTAQVADLRRELELARSAKPMLEERSFLNVTGELTEHLARIRNNTNTSMIEPIASPQPATADERFPTPVRRGRAQVQRPVREQSPGIPENVPQKERTLSPEKAELKVAELDKYVAFLAEKEKDVQAKLGRMPKKCRNGTEIREKMELEKELQAITDEIHSIKAVIKK